MYSRCLNAFGRPGAHPLWIAVPMVLIACLPVSGAKRVLRVCADPNNLPFSNQLSEGFENRLADTVARDLDATLVYTWWSQRGDFVKNSLAEARCDVWMGVPSDLDSVSATIPYYRST